MRRTTTCVRPTPVHRVRLAAARGQPWGSDLRLHHNKGPVDARSGCATCQSTPAHRTERESGASHCAIVKYHPPRWPAAGSRSWVQQGPPAPAKSSNHRPASPWTVVSNAKVKSKVGHAVIRCWAAAPRALWFHPWLQHDGQSLALAVPHLERGDPMVAICEALVLQ